MSLEILVRCLECDAESYVNSITTCPHCGSTDLTPISEEDDDEDWEEDDEDDWTNSDPMEMD